MAEKMLMLALSPTMEEGTVVSWHKKEGDSVVSGEVVCEVETDKATMDYESVQEGTILKILVPEGENAAVEQAIAIIGRKDEDISEFLKETEKSAVDEAGTETGAEAGAGAGGADGQAAVEAGGAGGTGTAANPEERQTGDERVKSSPLARSLATEAGIDLHDIAGSGPDGRIVKRDIEEILSGGDSVTEGTGAGDSGTPDKPQVPTVPAGPTGIQERHLPIGKKRQIIARRLSESKFTAPHYYLKTSIFTDSLIESRKKINEERVNQGKSKISLNAFLMKLTAEGIKHHPVINAGWEEKEIHIFGSIDIGLAVALEDGLITPVVRNCGGKGLIQIDTELQDLVKKAKKGKLGPEDYTGASFSISNLGSYGIEEFTAIINPPGSAILAVGTMTKVPIPLEENTISFNNRMKVTLSCDHRVIDGAVGAVFLRDLKKIIEDPLLALL